MSFSHRQDFIIHPKGVSSQPIFETRRIENSHFVAEIAASQNKKKKQEDGFYARLGDSTLGLFVLDGHGGNYTCNKMIEKLKASKRLTVSHVNRVLKDMDQEMYQVSRGKKEMRSVGSTFTGCLIDPDNKHAIHLVNIGDSRTMICNESGKVVFVTRCHDPKDPRERKRIQDAGGFISVVAGTPRIQNVISVSRALGDTKFKKAFNPKFSDDVISSKPEWSHAIPFKSKYFLVSGSDGLWKSQNPQDMASEINLMIQQRLPLKQIVLKMISKAAKSTSDNITMAILFHR